MSDKTETTILLDIYERLGAIETELKSINKDHDKVVAAVAKLDADVDDLKDFKKRIAAYIWLGGSIASGVLFFLWKGLEWGLSHWMPR